MALTTWYTIFLSLFDKHAPVKTKRVRAEEKPQWLTEEINAAGKTRDNLLLTTGKSAEFKKQRNKVTAMKRQAKKLYFSDLIASKKDTKSIWKAINELSGKKSATSSPSGSQFSPEKLHIHFSSIVGKKY